MEKNRTRISKGTIFRGTINTHKLTVEGKIKGDVKALSDVVIKDGAVVDGPIQTKSINFEEGGLHKGLIKLVIASEGKRRSWLSSTLMHNASKKLIKGAMMAFDCCEAFVEGMKEAVTFDEANH